MNLSTYLKAGYPGIAVTTAEEARAESEIAAVCQENNRNLLAWSSTEGMVDITEGRVTACPDPLDALQLLDSLFTRQEPQTVVLMRDLQLHMDHSDPMLTRRIKDILRVAKANGHTLILLGCRLTLPPELDHEITRIDMDLPGNAELATVLDGIITSAGIPEPAEEIREAALANARGLTTTEAENVFALSVVETREVSPAIIAREKAKTLKKNGLIEIVESATSLGDVGGLENLKDWLARRARAFGQAAQTYGLPAPERPTDRRNSRDRKIPHRKSHGQRLRSSAAEARHGARVRRHRRPIRGEPPGRHPNCRGHRSVRALDRRD